MSRQVEIAKIIASQIGTRRMMALGATKLTALQGGVGHVGGLTFKASLFGRQQCIVSVTLTPADLYNFAVFTARSKATIASATGIHCEELGTEIELAVENHFAKAN